MHPPARNSSFCNTNTSCFVCKRKHINDNSQNYVKNTKADIWPTGSLIRTTLHSFIETLLCNMVKNKSAWFPITVELPWATIYLKQPPNWNPNGFPHKRPPPTSNHISLTSGVVTYGRFHCIQILYHLTFSWMGSIIAIPFHYLDWISFILLCSKKVRNKECTLPNSAWISSASVNCLLMSPDDTKQKQGQKYETRLGSEPKLFGRIMYFGFRFSWG